METIHERYIDEHGVEYHVGIVLSPEKLFKFATVTTHEGYSKLRISRFLPYRDRPEEAKADLDAYAERKGWRKSPFLTQGKGD